MGWSGQTRHDSSVGNARPQIPPVKSVHKLLEIELPASATAPVEGPVNISFGVANDDIDHQYSPYSSPMKHHLGLRIRAERHLVLRLMLLGCTDKDRGPSVSHTPFVSTRRSSTFFTVWSLRSGTTSKNAYCRWPGLVRLTPTMTRSWSVPRPRLPGPSLDYAQDFD